MTSLTELRPPIAAQGPTGSELGLPLLLFPHDALPQAHKSAATLDPDRFSVTQALQTTGSLVMLSLLAPFLADVYFQEMQCILAVKNACPIDCLARS